MVLSALPPASRNLRMISGGESGKRPGWKLTQQPSSDWTAALASITFFSNSEKLSNITLSFFKLSFDSFMLTVQWVRAPNFPDESALDRVVVYATVDHFGPDDLSDRLGTRGEDGLVLGWGHVVPCNTANNKMIN